jgi:hypothetical protein
VSAAREALHGQFAALLAWERQKRLEQNALMVAGVALALAILLLPLPGFFPVDGLRWVMPLALMLLVAPWFCHRWRWRDQDSARAMVELDRSLNLAERATTAWELSGRDGSSAAHELVFKQADEKLRGFDARRQFPRQWHWQSYAAGPLLLLWLALLWFEVDRSLVGHDLAQPPSLAHKLGEFSRALQEKAASEGLKESLKAGEELEKLARENLAAKQGDEQLKKNLAGMSKKLEAAAQAGAENNLSTAGESQQALQDLKAELEAARDLLNFPDAAKASRDLPQQWLDRLASLPQLKRQLDKGAQAGPGSGANEMKSFLDQLERQTTGELDRRTLLDAQQFLEQLTKSGTARRNENEPRMAGRGERDGADDGGAKEKNYSNQPGKEPGKKTDSAQALPEFHGGAPTQVKGLLGDGDSNALGFKAKPAPGKSVLGQQEVAASYRRQAEQELNSEHVPETLKETIRNYFMSLENSEPRK